MSLSIEPGSQLLHYRIVEKIGEGGMGQVWKAVDTTLDRDVAIKVLPANVASDAGRLARFEREHVPATTFCRAEGVSTTTFYKWRARLARDARAVDVVEVEPIAEHVDGSGVELDVATGTAGTCARGDEANFSLVGCSPRRRRERRART